MTLITMARLRLREGKWACGFFRSYSWPQELQMTALHMLAPTVPRYHGHGPLRTDRPPHFGQGTLELSSFLGRRDRGRFSSSSNWSRSTMGGDSRTPISPYCA